MSEGSPTLLVEVTHDVQRVHVGTCVDDAPGHPGVTRVGWLRLEPVANPSLAYMTDE